MTHKPVQAVPTIPPVVGQHLLYALNAIAVVIVQAAPGGGVAIETMADDQLSKEQLGCALLSLSNAYAPGHVHPNGVADHASTDVQPVGGVDPVPHCGDTGCDYCESVAAANRPQPREPGTGINY